MRRKEVLKLVNLNDRDNFLIRRLFIFLFITL